MTEATGNFKVFTGTPAERAAAVFRASVIWADLAVVDDGDGSPNFRAFPEVTQQGDAFRLYVELHPALCIGLTDDIVRKFFFAIAKRHNARFSICRSKEGQGAWKTIVTIDFMLDPSIAPARRRGYYRETEWLDNKMTKCKTLPQPRQQETAPDTVFWGGR